MSYRGENESEASYARRRAAADANAERVMGGRPHFDEFRRAGINAALAVFPAYFCLLLFGYHDSGLQWPLILAGVLTFGGSILSAKSASKRWSKLVGDYLEQTKP